MPLYICGFVTLGAAFQKHLSVGAVIMGWGIAEVAVMINTVAICKPFPPFQTVQRADPTPRPFFQTHTATTASRRAGARSPRW